MRTPRLLFLTACGAIVLNLLGAADVHARAGGSIVGVVMTSAKPPRPLRVTVDPAVCGSTLPDESIVVDDEGHLANAVVTLSGVPGSAPAEAAVANQSCRFVPRVALLRPGGSVHVVSHDDVLHTTRAAAASGRVLFNVGLPVPNLTLSKSIDEAGVVSLSCNTHTWMRGFLFVTDERSAITGADGMFRLDDVPVGTYELRLWHEALHSPPARIIVQDGQTAHAQFEAR